MRVLAHLVNQKQGIEQKIEHIKAQFAIGFNDQVSQADDEYLCQEIYRLVQKSASRGLTESELCKASRYFNAATIEQRVQALAVLSEQRGAIHQHCFKPLSGRGKPRLAWVLKELVLDKLDLNKTRLSRSIALEPQGIDE
jgi:hypothetical protein